MANYNQPEGIGNNDPIDTALAAALFFGLMFAGLAALWIYYDEKVKYVTMESAMWLRYVQFPFALIGPESYANKILNLHQLRYSLTGENMSNAIFIEMLAICFRSLAILMLAGFLPWGIYKIINHRKLVFERELDLGDLIALQREKYPRTKPPTARNLLEVDPRFGPWATQFNAIELVLDKNLLSIENRHDQFDAEKKEAFERQLDQLTLVGLKKPKSYQPGEEDYKLTFTHFKGCKHPTGKPQNETPAMLTLHDELENYLGTLRVDKKGVEDYYKASLGELCRYKGRVIDINYLPPTERAIWMLLCACVAGKSSLRNRIEALLDQMADNFKEDSPRTEYPDHEIDLTGIFELYTEVTSNVRVRKTLVDIAEKHAYYYTAFTALYIAAKDTYGTIITRDFIWLKTVNRLLYLSLNQIGLEASRAETAGIRAHYKAEEKDGKRISTPIIDSAVLSLVHELHKEGWTVYTETEEDRFGMVYWLGDAPAVKEEEDAA